MGTERRRLLVLGALVVVLVVVLGKLWTGGTSASLPATSNGPVKPTTARTQKPAAAPAPPSVHLDALNGERPKPESAERDLFRFKPKAPPVRTAPPSLPPQPPAPIAPPVPAGPAPPPPITLKFIGLVESPTHGEKIAILSDGRNAPFYGREGAIIEGRYRILKIGVESVELAYVDGRGRQTIRLTGS